MKKMHICLLAASMIIQALNSCSKEMTDASSGPEKIEATIVFSPDIAGTKATDPDEMKITDLNIFVFNAYGILETKAYLPDIDNGSLHWPVELLRNAGYSVYACANFGYSLDIDCDEDLAGLRYYLAYPDDYSLGIPMCGRAENIMANETVIEVPLQRLMARIAICVDRSQLDRDVEFNIRDVRIERCPRYITPFADNRIADPFGFFPSGFIRKDYETDALNTVYNNGKSEEIYLYMLENMQGDLLPGNTDETLKVLPENTGVREMCTYIEIRAEYLSGSYQSSPGEYLIYRLYPGDNPGNFDIRRNSEYRICITPVGSGLDGTEWRIDRTGIEGTEKTVELSYTELTLSYIGETASIKAYVTPSSETGDDILVWESDAPGVASVSDDGTVTALAEGVCIVRCYPENYKNSAAECRITVKASPYYMKIFPGNFIRCRKGDIIEISCDYSPSAAEFDIGLEELEYDKKRGIYDYAVSDDGKTVTIYTKNRGSGLIYMETGYPVNQSELIMLVID